MTMLRALVRSRANGWMSRGLLCHQTRFLSGSAATAITTDVSSSDKRKLEFPDLFTGPKISLPIPRPVLPQRKSTLALRTRMLKTQEFQERMAHIQALLSQGEVVKAEILFNRTLRTNAFDVRTECTVGIVNAFLEAHLGGSSRTGRHQRNERRALDWYGRIPELGFTPDTTTFALLMSGALQAGHLSLVESLVKDMTAAGISQNTLLSHDVFVDSEDRAALQACLRIQSVSKKAVIETTDSTDASTPREQDSLLLSAIQDKFEPSDELPKEAPKEFEHESLGQHSNDASVETLGRSSVSEEISHQAQLILDSQQSQSPLQSRHTRASKKIDLATTNAIGVKILKETLGQMEDIVAEKSKYDQQIWLEERAHSAALQQMEEHEKKIPDSIKRIAHLPSDLVWSWHKRLIPAVEQLLVRLEQETDEQKKMYLTFLKLLSPELLSRITIYEFLKRDYDAHNGDTTAGLKKATRVMHGIGKIIEREYNLQQLRKNKNKSILKTKYDIHKLHSDGKLFSMTIRSIAKELEVESQKRAQWIPIWPVNTILRIGSYLATELIRVAVIPVKYDREGTPESPEPSHVTKEEPAFTHVKRHNPDTPYVIGMIEYHPALYELILKEPLQTQPWLLPMIVPPRPWVTWTSGGYLQHREEVVRVHNNPEHADYLSAADKENHLDIVLQALDALGMTPWVVNQDIFYVAARLWNEGVGGPSIPPKLEIPPIKKPTDFDTNLDARKAYKSAVKHRNMDLQNNFSQQCDTNYKIEVARAFLTGKMYFPHNMDFRGRAYPMPPHLNHLGNDLCRGLLLFADAKPLGPNGLNWLKVQVSSLMGNDKVSFEDRVSYADAHLDDIFDSADKPLEGRRWWMSADSPWQCLATCLELTAALRSPVPSEFMSRLPIHQDGSCNGLQHYAALGGDLIGAQQVNMTRSEKPQDVYSGVAQKVLEFTLNDAAKGVPEALLMKDRINRKLVKQTVMTNTYGVTFIGARKQVQSRLREARGAGKETLPPLTDSQMDACSQYITLKIFESMGAMFSGAREIQKWLNSTAGLIARSITPEDIPLDELELTEEVIRLGIWKDESGTEASGSIEDVPRTADESSSSATAEDGLLSSALKDSAESSAEEDLSFDHVEDVCESTPSDESVLATSSLLKKRSPVYIPPEKRIPIKMTSVIWTTPLGLPVVQPYRNWKGQVIDTALQSVQIRDPAIPSPVNPQKQSTAFPPNFIHSLDASHMMLSALACQKADITFASVHDSYWCHAADVDRMSSILRDAFVQLHSENIMEHLKKELLERYSKHRLPIRVPVGGPENLKKLQVYMQSKGKRCTASTRFVRVWAPLKLDPLPKRGEYSVTQVRDAPYFFH